MISVCDLLSLVLACLVLSCLVLSYLVLFHAVKVYLFSCGHLLSALMLLYTFTPTFFHRITYHLLSADHFLY